VLSPALPWLVRLRYPVRSSVVEDSNGVRIRREKALNAYVLHSPYGPDHGVGHPMLFGLAYGSLRWTVGCRRRLRCERLQQRHDGMPVLCYNAHAHPGCPWLSILEASQTLGTQEGRGMMRTLLLSTIVITLLGTASVLVAQSSDEAAVAQAVEAFRTATLTADRAQFTALTAEQLSYGHSGGRVENKTQFLDGATSGQSRWKFITITDQTITIVDNDAIVRHTLTGETERDGKSNPVRIGVLMLWHKQDGHWKLLARQAVRLEEAPRTN
jgi:Domain of unknown function (DUF4440)